jgi:hypothetical protein
MNFTREICLLDTPDTGVAELCARLRPGLWLIEAGHTPPAWHDPAQLLRGNGNLGAVALSLGSAAAIGLGLGPALIDRLAALGPSSGPLVGLALHELIVNAAIHGNLHVATGRSEWWQDLADRRSAITAALADPACAARVVTVAIGWRAAGLEAVIADEGDGYDTTMQHTVARGSGRGLRLARMVGQVDVLRGGRQAAITLPCLSVAEIAPQ